MNAAAIRAMSLAAILSLGGCDDSLTEVLVVVDTDLIIPAELDRVRITVTAPDGRVDVAEGPIGGLDALPATLGVIHRGGELGEVRVVAEGMLGATVVVSREATFTFIHERVHVLRLDLLRGCVGVECGEEMTCGEAGCRAERVEGAELPRYDGSLDRDGGVLDGGSLDAAMADAGVDADGGPRDGGLDAGDTDAGLVCTDLPAQCGARFGDEACSCRGCACDLLCDPTECSVDCQDGAECTTSASDGGAVDLQCRGSDCSLDASGSANVTASCDQGASCDVDCSGVDVCRVACRSGSSCLLHCDSARICELGSCSATTCPSGEIVCRRPCP